MPRFPNHNGPADVFGRPAPNRRVRLNLPPLPDLAGQAGEASPSPQNQLETRYRDQQHRLARWKADEDMDAMLMGVAKAREGLLKGAGRGAPGHAAEALKVFEDSSEKFLQRVKPDMREDLRPRLDAERKTLLRRAAKDEIKARQDYFTSRIEAGLKQAAQSLLHAPETLAHVMGEQMRRIDEAELRPEVKKALKVKAEDRLRRPQHTPEAGGTIGDPSARAGLEKQQAGKGKTPSLSQGTIPAAQPRTFGELRAYHPTVHEQAKYLLADALHGLGVSKYEANRKAGKLTQIAGFTPVIGDAADIGEAVRNPTALNVGVAGLGLLPGAGDLLKHTLKQAIKKAKKLGSEPEFVIGADGKIDFGQIGPDVTKASKGKYKPAPIRLETGVEGYDGFGAKHITPDKHIRARDLGYKNDFELIEHVAKSYDTVVQKADGRLMLVTRHDANRYIIIEYRRNWGWLLWFGKKDPYYGVTTGYPENRRNVGRLKRTELYRELHKRGGKLLKGEVLKKND